MTLPPKVLTVLALVQCLLIAIGFLTTRAFLHSFNVIYEGTVFLHTPVVPFLPHVVSNFGLWFLLVPVTWSIVAAARAEIILGDGSISRPQFITGIALTILFAILSYLSICSALGYNSVLIQVIR